MLYEYLKGLNIHSNLKLHELQELIAEHFYYEEERGKLFLKSDLNTVISIPDFKILLSKVDVTVSESYYSSALSSEKIDRLRWIDLATKRLPKWDSKPRIEQLSNHFILVDEQQRELFNKVFRFWIIKAAEMIANPSDEIAVNRLVFCVQSDKQGVGKTTFGRMLTAPFNEGVVPAVYEMDRPDFGKDAMIQLTTNTLVILDDINNWHSGKLKQLKSVISSKNIKVRPPYGAMTVSRPRTASFFATTNELGFLNEENDTRWAVFRISDIDKAYNNIDLSQVWSEAFHYAQDSDEVLFTEEIKEFCIQLSSKHQLKTELDEIVIQWFEECDDSSPTYDLYEQLPYDIKKLLGNGTGAVSKLGKSLVRVFGGDKCYRSGGVTKWRLRFKSNRS
jgi:hypothetical protein